MIIEWLAGENFQIKTKTLTIKIGQKNVLGELEINGPGEYEIKGVQMEIIDGIIEVFAETLTIGYIKKGKVLSDADLQKLNGIDILLIGIGGGNFSQTKTALEIINQIEPSIVIPMYSANLKEFTKEEGAGITKDELKISKAELTIDERQIIILNPKEI